MNNEYFKLAYKEAQKAYKVKEVPVGAVIVKNNKVLARAHNNRQKTNNLLGHAEINCILKAEKKIKDWRLDECDLYVTLEPCDLCKIFIKESRIRKVYFLLSQENQCNIEKKEERTKVCDNACEKYYDLLTSFFKNLRN